MTLTQHLTQENVYLILFCVRVSYFVLEFREIRKINSVRDICTCLENRSLFTIFQGKPSFFPSFTANSEE